MRKQIIDFAVSRPARKQPMIAANRSMVTHFHIRNKLIVCIFAASIFLTSELVLHWKMIDYFNPIPESPVKPMPSSSFSDVHAVESNALLMMNATITNSPTSSPEFTSTLFPTSFGPTLLNGTTATPIPTNMGTYYTLGPTSAGAETFGPTNYATKSSSPGISSRKYGTSKGHPRVACFMGGDEIYLPIEVSGSFSSEKGSSCGSDNVRDSSNGIKPKRRQPESIPLKAKSYKRDKENEEAEKIVSDENCTLSNPSLQSVPVAPPTCNDIHSLGFDSNLFGYQNTYFHRFPMSYLTMGGAKSIWKVTSINGEQQQEIVILKTNKVSKFLKRFFWEHTSHDALIAGQIGNSQLLKNLGSVDLFSSNWNHVLPIYHYCGLANIVPYAQMGTLDTYIKATKGNRSDPLFALHLSLQVARGLYQAQTFVDGKATYVHADLNPSQFLVFEPSSQTGFASTWENGEAPRHRIFPILQINDFNQGRFLTRSTENNETCPFRVCTKNLRGNRYHSPERYQYCVDQTDGIDTFSLGGIFYFLLTNGFDPYFHERSWGNAIMKGTLPLFNEGNSRDITSTPTRKRKRTDSEQELFEGVFDQDSVDHPAYIALKEIIVKCMTLELKDRPTSLEIVRLLETKINMIE